MTNGEGARFACGPALSSVASVPDARARRGRDRRPNRDEKSTANSGLPMRDVRLPW